MPIYGRQLVDLAATQRGKRYRFATEVRPGASSYYGTVSWDCSELVERTCAMLGVAPPVPDGAVNQWRHCRRVSVAEASRTAGALLFAGDGRGGGRDAIHHVAFSRGDGYTEEARSKAHGVGSWPVGSRFSFGGLIPGVEYGPAPAPPQTLPDRPTIRLGDRNRHAEILNWELAVVTGWKIADGGLFGWDTCAGLQAFERVMRQEWGDCTVTTGPMWAALDFLALSLGHLVAA